MVVIRDLFEFLRYSGRALVDQIHRQVARCNPEIECQADGGSTDCREQCVRHGVGKDTARFFFSSQCG